MSLLGEDSDPEVKLNINEGYAKSYNKWRQKEELEKLKNRYGNEADIESSSSDDDSANDPAELSELFEKDFFKTLSCLKKKDPRIYDQHVNFFEEKDQTDKKDVKKCQKMNQQKPLYLRDYERKIILERGGKLSDDEDMPVTSRKHASLSAVEEQEAIKDSLKQALKQSDDDDDDDNDGEDAWGNLFQKRHKSQEHKEKEEKDYLEWLKGQKDNLPDKSTESELKFLHDYWNDPKLDEKEQFLKDYILNKRFLDEDDEDDESCIPTYDDIVQDSDMSEDGRNIEEQEKFEHKFNFRFEEPDQDFIKRYPRTVESSLRKKDGRRKQKRDETKERKLREKIRKQEELKQLKALKRKEIAEKIETLKRVTGNEQLAFKDADLEADFNPEEHDKRMNQLFNDDFYGEEDRKKPRFNDIDEELEIENWDKWDGNDDTAVKEETREPFCEDPYFNMDCEYDPSAETQDELIGLTKKKKRKRQSKFAKVLANKKPLFDPKDKTFEEYVNEYYSLDFEDIIGDLPCRFKYRKVVPNSFGLSVGEILKANDKELNKWCSLKKAVMHRPETVERFEVQAYEKKARNENLKRKCLSSLFEVNDEPNEGVGEQQIGMDVKTEMVDTSGTSADDGVEQMAADDTDVDMTTEVNALTPSQDSAPERAEVNLQCPISQPLVNGEKQKKSKKRKRKNSQTSNSCQNTVHVQTGEKIKVEDNGIEVTRDCDSKGLHKSGSNKHSAKRQKIKAEVEDAGSADANGNVEQKAQEKSTVPKNKKKKKKKKASKKPAQNSTLQAPGELNGSSKRQKSNSKKASKRKLYSHNSISEELPISDARLRAYGIRPKVFKNKLKYGMK